MEEEQIRQRVIEIAQELDIDPDIKVEFVSEIPDRVFAQEPVIVYASERRMLFNLQKFNDFVGDKTTYADCYIAHEVLGTRYHNRSIEYAVPEGIPSRILYEHFVAKFLDTAEDLTIYRNTPDKYLALIRDRIAELSPTNEIVQAKDFQTKSYRTRLFNISVQLPLWVSHALIAPDEQRKKILEEIRSVINDYPQLKEMYEFLLAKLSPIASGQISTENINKKVFIQGTSKFYAKWAKSSMAGK